MRYYAGNWATTAWLFRKGSGAEEKLDTQIKKPARIIVEQVGDIYDPETAEFLLNKGLSPSARCTRTAGRSTACSRTRSTTSRTTTCARAS